jgi:aminopeptidase N
MNTRLLLLAFIFLSLNITAQKDFNTRIYLDDPAWTPREHNVDFQHLLLNISFNPEEKKVIGEVTHTFTTLQKQVDTLFLDAPAINILSAELDGEKVNFKIIPEGVVFNFKNPLKWKTQHNLHIHYEAIPKKGLYFIGWDDPNNISRKQIWTQGQGIDNRYWLPMYDEMNDKITSEVYVTFNSKYKVLSNGVLVQQKINKKSGTTTWHYKMNHPHAPYLIMLGIGEYKIKTITSKSGVKINLWYYPEWENRVEKTYRYSAQMMDFFEKETGVKFPWENYSQIPVQDFMYGAMENTTATLFGDFLFTDDRALLEREYLSVNAHELAHQWFGDFVTVRSDAHHWLQESFATFYNWMIEREFYGQEHYDWNRRNAQWNSLNASKKDDKQVMHSQAGSTRHYPKGAFVLHMLRNVVGHDEYNTAIKHYLQKHAYDNVDTEDLLTAFHETLGNSYDWFFEQWLYHGGEPHYKVHFADIEKNGTKFHQFKVEQIQPTNRLVSLFKMPVTFRIVYKDGTKTDKTVWVENQYQEINIPAQKDKTFRF